MDLKVKEELTRGLQAAKQLRYLMAESRGRQKDESSKAAMKDHSIMILEAFDAAISIVKQCQLDRRNGIDFSFNIDLNASKTRSNRRKNHPKATKEINTSVVTEDGYYWRKYGQKPIVNSRYPREYYRCGHSDQGCLATKQVQMTLDNPIKNYKIMYYGNHTCQHLLKDSSPQIEKLVDKYAEKDDPNMLSFENSNNVNHVLTHFPSNVSSTLSNAWTGMQSVPLDQGPAPSPSDPTTITEPQGTAEYPFAFSPYDMELDYSPLMADDVFDSGLLQLWEDL